MIYRPAESKAMRSAKHFRVLLKLIQQIVDSTTSSLNAAYFNRDLATILQMMMLSDTQSVSL